MAVAGADLGLLVAEPGEMDFVETVLFQLSPLLVFERDVVPLQVGHNQFFKCRFLSRIQFTHCNAFHFGQ
ncbi:hypothetical protein D3C86_1839520 [compost metagenome]